MDTTTATTTSANRDKHPGERAIQIWLPKQTLAQIDRHLKIITAGILGAKASRHGWIRALIDRELSARPTDADPYDDGDSFDPGETAEGYPNSGNPS